MRFHFLCQGFRRSVMLMSDTMSVRSSLSSLMTFLRLNAFLTIFQLLVLVSLLVLCLNRVMSLPVCLLFRAFIEGETSEKYLC